MDNKDHIKDTFDLERGRAIDAFANIESQLCWVMADAGKIDHQIASVIFYSNISMSPRIEIVTAILEASCGDQFKKFWDSVRKIVASLNKQRNKIVHWHDYPVFEGADIKYVAEVLIHPVIGDKNAKLPQLAIDDLRQFIKKAKYTSKVLGVFRRCFDERLGDAIVRRDIEKFSDAEITFPPPKNDLFFS
ncbi:hypothetical protein GJG85_21090 [Burkholderia sp. MS389]|uniref:hypothetical protein n=1 Tax=unclassified Burkholderia TaxID=2613784 RepID=UPI0011774721|nr:MULTISPECIES: hypothetical protein [unclassified Burkholderia]QRR15894.1 hypothetical protein GJG85_21090 [Burkholderia sp. MS389]